MTNCCSLWVDSVPYNQRMAPSALLGMFCVAGPIFEQGCVSEITAIPEEGLVRSSVAVGRVIAVLTGERSRKHEPAVRSFEVQNR